MTDYMTHRVTTTTGTIAESARQNPKFAANMVRDLVKAVSAVELHAYLAAQDRAALLDWATTTATGVPQDGGIAG